MSGFKDMVAADIGSVFMNTAEFADSHTVVYDDVTYENVPLVLSGIKEKDRRQTVAGGDHAQGLFLATSVMHCAAADLGGVTPEKGARIKISDGDFLRQFYVSASVDEAGMLRVELEAIDE